MFSSSHCLANAASGIAASISPPAASAELRGLDVELRLQTVPPCGHNPRDGGPITKPRLSSRQVATPDGGTFMRPTIKRLLVIGAIATTGMFASVSTTHAAPAPHFAGGHVASRPMIAGAKVLNTFIVPKKAKEGFSPTKLTVPDVTGANCTQTNYSFLVTNITVDTQQLAYGGSPILNPIPSGTVEWICVDNGGVGGSLVLNLAANAKANLTITVLP
jgi:hypothetical protein